MFLTLENVKHEGNIVDCIGARAGSYNHILSVSELVLFWYFTRMLGNLEWAERISVLDV